MGHPPPTLFDPSAAPPDCACPFCIIAHAYEPYNPTEPPEQSSHSIDPELISPSAYIVLSTPDLVAFLDILPLSHGHLLLCPREHREKLSDVTADEAAQLGRYLRILSKAMTRTTGVDDWNVVQNNGAAAAQVVPHMHYHIIPRPDIRASGRYSESFTMFGRGKREELDEDDAHYLAEDLRRNIAAIMKEEEEEEEVKLKAKL
ncbi:HIT-like domain-containing protein [Mariannaea sp. PMI_226]|nr:HIT-like domain-containing protein [Mariannaea sp. PMI_226]